MRYDDKSFISMRILWEVGSANLRNLWLAAFVGFLVTVVLGAAVPIIGHLIGGLVAGLIAGGSIGRGALAGFLAGIFGGIIIAILIIVGSIGVGGIILEA